MEIKIGGKVLLIIIILIVIGIVAWSASGYFVEDENGGNDLTDLDKFAKCLTERGATIYVIKTCSACNSQKKMFGDSLNYINLVECTENQHLCQEKGISRVPTWIINGLPYVGVQSFERLSELTGCSLS